MTDKFKKLIDIINNLDLPENQKDDFLNVLLFVPDKDLLELIDEIEKEPNLIKDIIENYKLKKDALENNNQEKWNQIIEQEKKEAESF